MKMERNEYEAVQCAPPSEKDEEIHTRKLIGLQGSESRPSCRVCRPKSNTKFCLSEDEGDKGNRKYHFPMVIQLSKGYLWVICER